MPKAALYTLGCRLNQAETAIIANGLKECGFEIVGADAGADLTVINTCTVTEQADSKCRQAVRKSIRKNPDTFVAVIGCYAQMDIETIRNIKGVNLIIGNEHKLQLADYLDKLEKRPDPEIIHSKKISKNEFTIDMPAIDESHTRANLKIQDGCSFVCSFCIIAKARGPARSRKFNDILREAEQLANSGYKEIVLTGVNIGTYRQDGKDFLDVLKALESISGIKRIRISSIEPTTVNKALIDLIAQSKKICRHLHIPLQSGDDTILDSMRRKHTADDFVNIVSYAAEKIPGIGIGTDIMVGYPTESREQFINTKKLVVDLPLAYFHVFTYSDRKGTTSYNIKPKIEHYTKKQRASVMLEVGKRKKTAYSDTFAGKKLEILFEERQNDYWIGFSDNYLRVAVKTDQDLKNQLRNVRIKFYDGDKLYGELD